MRRIDVINLIDIPSQPIYIDLYIINYNNKNERQMSKQSSKKHRHNSLVDVPFTQRTAYFKQEVQADPYKTLPSKSILKTLLQQNQNIPTQNKYINNENECLKNIQDKLSMSKMDQKKKSLKKVANSCFKEILKNHININDIEGLQKKIESIIESRIKKMVEYHVEKHISKFMQNQKESLQNVRQIHEKEISNRLIKIEKGYDDILHTYDNFLIIAQKLKNKTMKSDKYAKKTQMEMFTKKTEEELAQVHLKLQKITSELQSLKKLDNSIMIDQDKINPISLKYNEAQDCGLEELKIIVNTYNQNFMQIDQKLQQIYSYLT